MSVAVGIDLGTTYSALACVNSAGRAEIVENREGERITPSVILFQGSEPVVGTMAKRSAPTAPDDCVQFVKRFMGDPSWKFTTSGGTTYSPEEVSALILRRIVNDAEATLGETITDVVISVPAYFDDQRRTATIDAGKIAGLNVLRLINEPTAAALSFGLDEDFTGNLLVYDLGGGTFDVTVMRVSDGVFDVLATKGDRNLGGFDWDNALMTWLHGQIPGSSEDDFDDPLFVADLRDKAEIAKRTLSNMQSTRVFLTLKGQSHQVEVSRDQFEEMTSDLRSRTGVILDLAIEASGLTKDQLAKVLLVGGSSRMPAVQDLVKTMTGLDPERGVNPDEVVALGAAVQAYILTADAAGSDLAPLDYRGGSSPVVRDVSSQALGVVVVDDNFKEFNSVIIPSNNRVPCQRSREYFTMNDNQTELLVKVTEGEDEDIDYVTVVGTSELRIPPYPKSAPVEVILSYDLDGVIHVEVIDSTAGQSLGEFEIDRANNLDRESVDEMAAMLREIEIH